MFARFSGRTAGLAGDPIQEIKGDSVKKMHVWRRALVGSMAVAALTVPLAACSGGGGGGGESTPSGDALTVGLVNFDTTSVTPQAFAQADIKAMEEIGWTVLEQDPKADAAQANTICTQYVTRGVDAIVVNIFESSQMAQCMSGAAGAGIPVFYIGSQLAEGMAGALSTIAAPPINDLFVEEVSALADEVQVFALTYNPGTPCRVREEDFDAKVAEASSDLVVSKYEFSFPGQVKISQDATHVGEWQRDPRVAVVTFTGSSRVGWQLKQEAPHKHHVLELGSNTAMVVAADADLGKSADAAVTAALANSGQACVSLQRVYVDRSIADEFVGLLADRFDRIRTGDPRDPETVVGPLIDDREVHRLRTWIHEAVQEGAELVRGDEGSAAVLAPTLLRRVNARSRVVCEEVFGPVLSVAEVDGVDEAIAAVNDSDFGLNTSIYTSDVSTALRYAREAEAGSVLINVPPSFRADNMPYGGVKESGQGREGVPYAVAELTRQKLVVLAP